MRLIPYENQGVGDWSPWTRMGTLRDEMNRLFESAFPAAAGEGDFFGGWSPALDVYQDDDKVTVTVELPGMKKEDIDIDLHDGALTISGERIYEKQEDEENRFRSERVFGRFHRSVSLPAAVDVDKVDAKYENGILKVTLPKAEEAKPRRIKVSNE